MIPGCSILAELGMGTEPLSIQHINACQSVLEGNIILLQTFTNCNEYVNHYKSHLIRLLSCQAQQTGSGKAHPNTQTSYTFPTQEDSSAQPQVHMVVGQLNQ